MSDHTLREIHIYPIKSLKGIALKEAIVERRGLKFDRRWMLVDEGNRFMTQRSNPEMALISVELSTDGLLVSHSTRNISQLIIPFDFERQSRVEVKIWESKCLADEVSTDANKWFSEVLNKNCKLVFMPDSTERKINTAKAADKIVSFADGYPFLVIGQNSLNDLNSRLRDPVPMNRFRPNLVFEGGMPYEEDNWLQFKIGTASFLGMTKCGRCKVPTINQETAEVGLEPMKTMKTYRREEASVNFGLNAVTICEGRIQIGDRISN